MKNIQEKITNSPREGGSTLGEGCRGFKPHLTVGTLEQRLEGRGPMTGDLGRGGCHCKDRKATSMSGSHRNGLGEENTE